MDQIPLGETIPAMSMVYVYKVPTLTDVCYKNPDVFLEDFSMLQLINIGV